MEDSKPRQKIWSGDLWRLGLCVLVIYLVFKYILLAAPPAWFVRRDQRKKVRERVEAAGGWRALQSACDGIVESNRESWFDWRSYNNTNTLPPALTALQPMEVWYDPPKHVRGSTSESEFSVVHIRVFGMHRTGTWAIPYYGLELVSGTNTVHYVFRPELAAEGNSYDTCRKITNGIYEISGPQ
jgi:hypothetical protein